MSELFNNDCSSFKDELDSRVIGFTPESFRLLLEVTQLIQEQQDVESGSEHDADSPCGSAAKRAKIEEKIKDPRLLIGKVFRKAAGNADQIQPGRHNKRSATDDSNHNEVFTSQEQAATTSTATINNADTQQLNAIVANSQTQPKVKPKRRNSQKISTPKPEPLIVSGLSQADKINTMAIYRRLHSLEKHIAKVVQTNKGTVLVFPKTTADRDQLLTIKDGEISFSVTKRSTRQGVENLCVVVMGLDPNLTDDELSRTIGKPCTRIRAAKFNGSPTYKVKITCSSMEEKAEFISNGVKIGFENFRVTDYKQPIRPQQCFKCQQFGHMSRDCNNSDKCRKCAGNHRSSDCQNREIKCANCNGTHRSSDLICPELQAATTKTEAAKMSYSMLVKKGGDTTDCVRLGCCIATSVVAILNKHTTTGVQPDVVCNEVATNISHFYKVNITGALIHETAYPEPSINTHPA